MTTSRFDLIEVVHRIRGRFRFILGMSSAALVLGVLIYFIRPKTFEAKTSFFMSNPVFLDRSNIFGGADGRFVNYFGDEDDIDRIIALAESDSLAYVVMRKTGYDADFRLDLSQPKDRVRLKEQFADHLNLKRTAYKLVEASFTHEDPKMAARVANTVVQVAEDMYRDFYDSRKEFVFQALAGEMKILDSSMAVLTDTLARLREVSGIYSLISPVRNTIMSGEVKTNGNEPGRYIEVIQNFESVKDMVVRDRANYLSLMHQYAAALGEKDANLLHVITRAQPPVKAAGPGLLLTAVACFLTGFLFSVLYVLLAGYYREAQRSR